METIHITARQADVWRSAAAVILNGVRGDRCADIPALVIRDTDEQYATEVAQCLMAALVVGADRVGARHPKVELARAILDDGDEAISPEAALEAAHQAAHLVAELTILAHGRDVALRRAEFMVEKFATGNFGPDVTVDA